ncbi:MAG: imidazole glycerol phosphate synthase subunit HisH [Xanthomonadales bacterium]|nr:imidazole glycerol phosphate synthase subunit HisH [Gammaproteobacteria bacterium]NNE04174.1 imidazole glycerol phosphate synthase subunit HisH [Xanthomonadales bacterium]NNL94989.1 imidazole glycerol phosphate synthase subunit HisH [Xanthomonadales bacterium]
MSTVAIIDSGGANIGSVHFALQRLGVEAQFTADPAVISAADRVILPGVGAAAAAMAHLQKHELVGCIRALKQPVLGICLGMQLLFDASDEGDVNCLGIIPGQLTLLPGGEHIRIPHMGWNSIRVHHDSALLDGLGHESWFYFVHSYFAPLGEHTLAGAVHGIEFSAIVQKGNFFGVQFHPERSAQPGARLLHNFLELPCN